MSHDKEMRFFTDPDCAPGSAATRRTSRPGSTYRGESTPQYTKWPIFPGVVDRMADLVPDARLIFLVRDPVQRTIAEYVEEATWSVITEDIEAALADVEEPHNRIVAPSRYATQLRSSTAGSTRARCWWSTSTSCRTIRRHDARIFEFLGLAQIELTEEALRPRNSYGDKGTHPALVPRAAATCPDPPGAPAAHGQLERLRALVRRRVSKPVERPEPSPATLERLRAELAPEAEELRTMTGLTLGGWSV